MRIHTKKTFCIAFLSFVFKKYLTEKHHNHQHESNIIVVDWSQLGNRLWYPQSASNVRTVGAHTSLIVGALKSLHPSYIYCIGHSLGAHVCGHAGLKARIDRITGCVSCVEFYLSCKSCVNSDLRNVE